MSLCPSAETERCLDLELSWSICRLWAGDAALPIPKKSEEGVAFFLLGQCFTSHPALGREDKPKKHLKY